MASRIRPDSLKELARLLIERGADPELMDRVNAVCEREEKRAYAAIAALKPRVQGKKVLLITGGVKSWSVVAALLEAGFEMVGTSVKKSTREDKERIKEIMGQDAHMIEDMKPRDMYKMLRDAKADIMLSGGRSQFVALKATMPWLDINQERHHGYMGYVGMVNLVKEIDRTLSNPVWQEGAKARALGEGWRQLAGEEPSPRSRRSRRRSPPIPPRRKRRAGQNRCACARG